jgi:hypothetical protein
MEEKLLTLHSNLVKEGYELPDYGTFKTDMSDPLKSKKLHDSLVGEGYELPDYDTFIGDMGLVKKKSFSVLDSLTPTSGKEELPFLDASGKPLTAQPQSPSAEKPRETGVLGDLFRTLKSNSLKTAGAVLATPQMVNRTLAGSIMRPLIKSMGGNDRDAELALNNISSTYPAGASMLQLSEAQAPLNKRAQKIEEEMHQIEGNIWENLTKGEDGKKNIGAALEQFGRGTVASVPLLALTAATAGGGAAATLGTIGAVSASQQYAENENMPTERSKILNAWMYGGFEALGELASAYIFRGIGTAFQKGLIKEITPSGAKDIAKGIATSVGLESSSEGITQIGQNITDIVTGKNPNAGVFDNVFDAMLIGGLGFGLVGGAANPLASLMGKTLASDKEVKQVQDNLNQQKVLIDQLDQTDSDPVKNALKRSIKDLRVQADEVMDANYELATKLSPEKQAQVAELYSVWNELQAKIDNKEVTEQEVPALENTIKGIKDQIQGIKDEQIAIEEEKVKEAEGNEPKEEAPKVEPTKEEQLKAIEDLKAAEKTDEPAGTITPLETKDGRDWFNVVKDDGQRQTFGVPEGSPQEVVDAKSKEYLKPPKVPYVEINSENISEIENNTISSLREQGATEEEIADRQKNIDLIKQSVNERASRQSNPDAVGEYGTDASGGISEIRPEEIEGNDGQVGRVYEQRRTGNRTPVVTPEEQVANQTAPNGEKSNLSPENHAFVRTPEFKAKFGDWQSGEGSLVLDRNGEPLLVYSGKGQYHVEGLDPSVTETKTLHFTGSKKLAMLYAWIRGKQPVVYRGFISVNEKNLAEGNNEINVLHDNQQEFKITNKSQFIPVGIEEVPKIKKPKAKIGGEQNAEGIGTQVGQGTTTAPELVEGTQNGVQVGDVAQNGVETVTGEGITLPTDTATQVPSEGNVPPPPESGQIDVTESEKQGQKPLGAQERSLSQIETEQQQILSDIINENKGFYDTLHGEQAVKNANKFIEERGVDAATRQLEQPTKVMDIDNYPTYQVARMVLIDHYTRILGDPKATKEQKDNAYIATNKLQERISIEANKTGQGNAHLNLWKVMQPAGLLEFAKRHIAEFNRVKLNRKIGDKSIGQLLDLVYKQLSDASKEVIDDILAGKEIEAQMPVDKPNVKREPAKKKTVPKEQVKAEKDYRKKLLDDYRKSQGKVTLQAGIPLTAEQIELGGNLIASYVREGYYRAVDVINKLIDDLKAIGITVTEDDIDPILSTKKEGNQTFRSWMREQEASVGLTEEMKSLKLRISDIVKMHWSQRDELGRTLAQKLVDDAGLSEAEAKKLETAILTEYNKRIQDRLKSFKDLANLLGKEKVPTDKKKKTRLDRLIELVNLGALEEDVYRGLFADKFGLAPEITSEQGRIIMQKASVVQQMTDKGWFYREAVKDLTKYLYELNPTSKFNEWAETWIALSYSNMLFGYFTTILNLWSSGSNILLKPLRDATNMSRWLRAVKSNNPSGEVYMPGGEMYYMPMLQGIAHGATDAAEIYENGDVGSKYIEEITKSKQFRVGQLERDKFGKGKRFKPLKVGGIDLNIFNLNKYSGRNLSAQDRLMFNTIFEMEVASIIRRNLANTQNLTGQALSTAVMDELQGTKVDKEALNAQIEAEAAKFKELTGQETTDRQKKIRMRELMVKQLPITEEERLDAERLAQGNIFTDTRGGIVATLANAIGMLSNSNPSMGVIVKPFIPFTKIVGNVTEYMLDHVPFYGFLRANGYSVSGIKKKMNPDAMTAQMGKKGSNLYYEQMGRAWLGTMSFTALAMMFLGSDDEDYVQISGGYNQEGFKKGGRENVMPKYTLRIGDVEISYLNIPALAIPLGLIGNINDAIKMKMPSEEISNRLAATMLLDAVANTALMTKDMSFVQGTQNLLTLLTDAMSMEEGGWKRAGQEMAKTYLGFALRPLPQNSALVQQTWKFFDPVSYSQKDIKSILAYSAGLQHFVNYPTMDQLGDEVKTYPGEALLPYTHWFNIKGDDARWRFLADNNAIPNKVQNTTTYIDTEDGVEKRTLEVKELHDYTKLAGGLFSDKLEAYMGDTAKVSKRQKDLISSENYKGETEVKTGLQVDVEKMWADARKSARTALFRWYDFKKTNAKDWDLMLSTDAVKEPEMTAIEIEDGDKKTKLDKSQMVEYNQLTMEHYHERIMRYIDNKERVKEDKKRIMDNGKTRFDNKTDEEWTKARERAEKQMKRQLRDEKTNSVK